MTGIEADLIVLAAFGYFVKDVIIKSLWSIVLYMNRGEFNFDGIEDTVDRFDHHHPTTGQVKRCYIFKYGVWKIKWGFKQDGGWVIKKSFWLEWASWSKERFPVPIKIDSDDIESIIEIINRSQK